MQDFKSWRSYWNFEQTIKHKVRYIQGPEVHEFLKTVLITSQNRVEKIPAATILWRAQRGNALEPFYHTCTFRMIETQPFRKFSLGLVHTYLSRSLGY
jgi:hypothetical protein